MLRNWKQAKYKSARLILSISADSYRIGVISSLPDLRDHHVDDEDTAELGLGADLALVLTPVPWLY